MTRAPSGERCLAGLRRVWNGEGMWDWYWTLRGGELLFVTLGMIVGILVTVLGVLAGMVRWFGGLISGGMEHDQRTCPCWDCRRRRWQAVDRQRVRDGEKRMIKAMQEGEWASTYDLQVGWFVETNDKHYLVIRIEPWKNGGMQITFRNMATKLDALVFVKLEHLDIRYWRKVNR